VDGGGSQPEHGRGAPEPSPREIATWMVIGAVLVIGTALFSISTAFGPRTPAAAAERSLPPEPAPVLAAWPGPDDEYFPCTDCHEDEPTNRRVRKLEDEHEDLELDHGTLWCLDCHDADHRNQLHLANEGRVDFDESWRLCTQCHGSKLADWRAGVHGKRTGHWWGEKEYRTCVSCHAPHTPHFQPLEPKPPPKRPEQIVLPAATARPEETHG